MAGGITMSIKPMTAYEPLKSDVNRERIDFWVGGDERVLWLAEHPEAMQAAPSLQECIDMRWL